jgi:hypothetical protein
LRLRWLWRGLMMMLTEPAQILAQILVLLSSLLVLMSMLMSLPLLLLLLEAAAAFSMNQEDDLCPFSLLHQRLGHHCCSLRFPQYRRPHYFPRFHDLLHYRYHCHCRLFHHHHL